jgi:DNA-binding MarR family transcriptional regulator
MRLEKRNDPETIAFDPLNTPSFLIKQLAKELTRLAEAELRPLGVGIGSLPVLAALKSGAALTQADLARLLRVEQPSMAQTLARLERDGLIRRRSHPSNRRIQLIELTATGREALPRSKAILLKGNERVLAGFTADEAGLFLSLLKRACDNLIPNETDMTGNEQ